MNGNIFEINNFQHVLNSFTLYLIIYHKVQKKALAIRMARARSPKRIQKARKARRNHLNLKANQKSQKANLRKAQRKVVLQRNHQKVKSHLKVVNQARKTKARITTKITATTQITMLMIKIRIAQTKRKRVVQEGAQARAKRAHQAEGRRKARAGEAQVKSQARNPRKLAKSQVNRKKASTGRVLSV